MSSSPPVATRELSRPIVVGSMGGVGVKTGALGQSLCRAEFAIPKGRGPIPVGDGKVTYREAETRSRRFIDDLLRGYGGPVTDRRASDSR